MHKSTLINLNFFSLHATCCCEKSTVTKIEIGTKKFLSWFFLLLLIKKKLLTVIVWFALFCVYDVICSTCSATTRWRGRTVDSWPGLSSLSRFKTIRSTCWEASKVLTRQNCLIKRCYHVYSIQRLPWAAWSRLSVWRETSWRTASWRWKDFPT